MYWFVSVFGLWHLPFPTTIECRSWYNYMYVISTSFTFSIVRGVCYLPQVHYGNFHYLVILLSYGVLISIKDFLVFLEFVGVRLSRQLWLISLDAWWQFSIIKTKFYVALCTYMIWWWWNKDQISQTSSKNKNE